MSVFSAIPSLMYPVFVAEVSKSNSQFPRLSRVTFTQPAGLEPTVPTLPEIMADLLPLVDLYSVTLSVVPVSLPI